MTDIVIVSAALCCPYSHIPFVARLRTGTGRLIVYSEPSCLFRAEFLRGKP